MLLAEEEATTITEAERLFKKALSFGKNGSECLETVLFLLTPNRLCRACAAHALQVCHIISVSSLQFL